MPLFDSGWSQFVLLLAIMYLIDKLTGRSHQND